MVDKDPWAPESGLLTNYEGTIVDAWFGVDPAYNNGQTVMLMLKMQTDAPEKPEHEERFNLPNGWQTWDSGKTVEHESKSPGKTFNAQSQAGTLVTKIRENCPEAVDELRKRGAMTEAGVWIGLKFFWEEVAKEYSFKDRETGELRTGTSTRNFPTKYLGVVDTLLPPAVASAGVQPEQSTPPSLLSSADRVVLGAMAKTMDHGPWVEAVMEFDSGRLCADNAVIAALADEAGLYAELRGA